MSTSVIVSGTAGMPREALSTCLQVLYRLEVAEPCATEELRERLAESDVQVVVLAPTLGSLPEVTQQAAEDIQAANSQAQLVVISYRVDASEAKAAIEAGAQGMVNVGEGLSKLKEAIESASQRERYISPRMGSEVAYRSGGDNGKIGRREEEVLSLAARGYSNRQIAEKMHLSVRTVEAHRANINHKLELKDRKDLVEYAIQKGMLP